MLTTMCLQISMLIIYHPYVCHLKGKALSWLLVNKVLQGHNLYQVGDFDE
jgi:hypothetical protein